MKVAQPVEKPLLFSFLLYLRGKMLKKWGSIFWKIPTFRILSHYCFRLLLFVLILSSTTFLSSCFSDPEPQQASNLRFSIDTLLFDTVFTDLGSVSKRLTVYNDHAHDVLIANIKLADPESPYRLFVSGQETREMSDIKLRAKDSLLILADVTIDPTNENLPFIVRDSILFSLTDSSPHVKLISWGQNAHYLSDSVLLCDAVWSADKPYVLFNSILIDSLCSLTIEPGTQIYSHPGSAIFVKGTLTVKGTPEEPVLFSNDRFDDAYKNAPGQWEGIYFLEGSSDNYFTYTTIRNAMLGLRLGTPDDDLNWDLQLEQVKIENMASYGILTFTSEMRAVNVLISHCGLSGISHFAGGRYYYQHCTISGDPVPGPRNSQFVVLSDNVILADNSLLVGDLEVKMENSLIWGPYPDELLTSNSGETNFSINIRNSLLKTTDLNWDINNNILNSNPLFTDILNYDYSLLPESPLLDYVALDTLTIDLFGTPRTGMTDAGAIESN